MRDEITPAETLQTREEEGDNREKEESMVSLSKCSN
jgi:hypothetical protein